MTDRTCVEPDCGRSHHARGYCHRHYVNRRVRGEFPTPPKPPCAVDGCELSAKTRGWCNLHYLRWWRYGDVDHVPEVYRDKVGPAHPSWRGDEVGWTAVHDRLRAIQGKASEHSCIDCAGPAAEWSYDHRDANERPSEHGPYSLDPSHYDPRCIPCHRRFDRELAKFTLVESYDAQE